MRIPAFILDHPVEGVIAGVLLLALLLGSADYSGSAASSQTGAQIGPAQTQIAAAGKV